jgi:DNA-binding winged helix-turn-helix (wHTH) protein/tetratricopeptide (TPR) repeat protein
MTQQIVSAYEFGPFRLVPAERQLLRDGRPIALPPKAFDTLLILVQQSGHVLKKDELIQLVWPDAFVEDSNLNHYVSLLRRTLSPAINGEAYIETVRRFGFRFTAEVREITDEASAVLVHRHTRTHVVFKEETHEEGKHSLIERSVAEADGRTQATPYDRTHNAATRASAPHTMSRARSRLLVSVLIIVIVGGGLGAAYFGYIRPAHSATGKTASPSGRSPRRVATENPAAREAYLQGRSFWNKRTPADMRQAVKYFRDAVKADPNYAPAYAGMADAYLLGGVPDDETQYSAKDLARKALALDDSLAEAHASLAYYLSAVDWNWAEAEAEFLRAIELNPNYATAHHWYAYHLASVGRLDEALTEIKRAQEIDQDSLIIKTDVGHVFYLGQNNIYALAQFEKVIERDPNFADAHLRLGQAYLQKDMFDEALAEFKKAEALGKDVRGWLAYTYAVSGQRDKTEQLLHELKEGVRKGELRAETAIARVHAALGEQDQAFAWLQQACERRDGELALLKTDPTFKHLHSDPRFAELVRRMGLPL